MLLCAAPVEGQKSKEMFRPLEVVFPAIGRVDELLKSWVNSQARVSDAEVVLEKKSAMGDGYGVGAVWSAWFTVHVRSKHGSHPEKVKQLFEVKSFVPNQQLVLIATRDISVAKGFVCCKPDPNANPPAELTITAAGKGESTEVTAKISTVVPSIFSTCPKEVLLLPCFWPHFIIFGVMMLVCCPCCHHMAVNSASSGLRDSCDQGLSAIKATVEKGPPEQVMTDDKKNAPAYQQPAPASQPTYVPAPVTSYVPAPIALTTYQPSATQPTHEPTQPSYESAPSQPASPTYEPAPSYQPYEPAYQPAYEPPPVAVWDEPKNAFCTKCGKAMPSQDMFCGKCGSPR